MGKWTRLTLSLLGGLAAGVLAGGCWPNPPAAPVDVPRLQLGSTVRQGVLRAYGQPKLKTGGELWYVGPTPKGLIHGADGWMTLLTFDEGGCLTCQERLDRRVEGGYLCVDYWINGNIAGRGRDKDFDKLMIARCVELARDNGDYRVTSDEPNIFVLARLLPSENEPVVQWERDPVRKRVTMTVRALPGRDEPLMEKIDGAVGMRMLLIEVPADAEEHEADEHAVGPTG